MQYSKVDLLRALLAHARATGRYWPEPAADCRLVRATRSMGPWETLVAEDATHRFTVTYCRLNMLVDVQRIDPAPCMVVVRGRAFQLASGADAPWCWLRAQHRGVSAPRSK